MFQTPFLNLRGGHAPRPGRRLPFSVPYNDRVLMHADRLLNDAMATAQVWRCYWLSVAGAGHCRGAGCMRLGKGGPIASCSGLFW
jgi:hypothetical protein